MSRSSHIFSTYPIPNTTYAEVLYDSMKPIKVSEMPEFSYFSIPIHEMFAVPTLEDKILDSLSSGPLDTLSISKRVIGPSGTKAQVNPTLYNMKKKKLVMHFPKGNNQCWSLPQTLVRPIIVPPISDDHPRK